MASEVAYIRAKLLEWARTRAGLSTREAADRISVKAQQFASWESGDQKPTFKQAQKVARSLHIPFGYLFLSSPPEETVPIPDLRTIADNQRNVFSVEFLELLNDVLLKQQWYHDYLEAESTERLPFIGRFGTADSVYAIAEDIRQTIGIDDRFRSEAPNWGAFLGSFIDQVESARILVLRSGIVKNDTHRKLSVEEFRGFVITDPIAPLIFLNGRDSRAAQIFTLAHELAHLWIGQSGISNPDLGKPQLSSNQLIERFCNRVAAEVLVPHQSFVERWGNAPNIAGRVKLLAKDYKVSSLVILRRAYDLGKLSWNQYRTHYAAEIKKFQALETRQQSAGGNFYFSLERRNGKQFIRAVLSEAFEGRVPFRDAARLLGLKVSRLESVASLLGVR
jgi:Zn-dependent peptidase ImmA (M78 family)/transcriptional regulator with XRE-family HTH domain